MTDDHTTAASGEAVKEDSASPQTASTGWSWGYRSAADQPAVPKKKQAKKKAAKKKVPKKKAQQHHAPPSSAPNPRDGKMKESKGDDAPSFQGGSDAAPPTFGEAECKEICEQLGLYWQEGGGEKFLVKNGDEWSEWTTQAVKSLLRTMPGRMIAYKPREGEPISETDRLFLYVRQNRVVHKVLDALAGHQAGLLCYNQSKYLVKRGFRPVEPKEGEFPVLKSLVEDRLKEQAPYFWSWLKWNRASLASGPGNFLQTQALILAGRGGTAKSRLQHWVISPMLGSRSASPDDYMFGRSNFNDEMIEAEHQLMEDPINTTLTKDRVFFGERIKQMAVNDQHRLHPKGVGAMTAQPFWVCSISVNDDPDKLRVLPLITPDIEHKLSIFRVHAAPMPMPSDTPDEKKALRAAVQSEWPALAYWLDNVWEIPEDMRSERYGVAHYHDPSLMGDLLEDTPSAELLSLIDMAEFTTDEGQKMALWELPDDKIANWAARSGAKKAPIELWKGPAQVFENLMLGEVEGLKSSVAREMAKIAKHNNVARLLARLREDFPGRVDNWRTAKFKGWMISAPGEEAERG